MEEDIAGDRRLGRDDSAAAQDAAGETEFFISSADERHLGSGIVGDS